MLKLCESRNHFESKRRHDLTKVSRLWLRRTSDHFWKDERLHHEESTKDVR